MLSASEKETLLRLARQALRDGLRSGRTPGYETDAPTLLEPRAAFVTLRRRDSGELRGCRGEWAARRPLIEAVVRMAVAAATDDERFSSVAQEEVSELQIEISALTPLRPIRPDEVVVGQHGLMIVKGKRSGLLLPQVPLAFGWDRVAFLSGLCRKAGLPTDAWATEEAKLFGFECEAWREED